MPTVSAKPNIFSYSNDMDRTGRELAKYGIGGPYGGGDKANMYTDLGRAAQMDALSMYRAGALGNQPSVAQQMLQQQTGANNRAGMQMAAMGRGGNLAGMQQQALARASGANAQATGQGALLRAQEIQANQAGLAQLGQGMSAQGFGYDSLGAQTQLQSNQQMLDYMMGKRLLDMQQDQNRFSRGMQIANGVIGGISAIGDVVGGAMSDERMKTNVQPTNPYTAEDAWSPFLGGVDEEGGTTPYAPHPDMPFGERVQALRAQKPPLGSRAAAGLGINQGAGAGGRYAGLTIDPFEGQAEAQTSTKVGEIGAKMGMVPRADGTGMTSAGATDAAPGAQGAGIVWPGSSGGEMSGFETLGAAAGGRYGEGGDLQGDHSGMRPQGSKGGFAGLGVAFSDERAKTGVRPAGPVGTAPSATQAIDAVNAGTGPSSFEYKPGAGPPGPQVGVMAQDLERSPAGAAIVQDTPAGKVVDGARAATLSLAALAEARQREKVLEVRLARVEAQAAQPVATTTPGVTDALRMRAKKGDAEIQPGGPAQVSSPAVVNPNMQAKTPLAKRNKKRFEEDLRQGPLNPQQQQMMDDFWDEMDKWTYVDEATGRRKIGARRVDLGATPRSIQRYSDEVETLENAAARQDQEASDAQARRAPRMI